MEAGIAAVVTQYVTVSSDRYLTIAREYAQMFMKQATEHSVSRFEEFICRSWSSTVAAHHSRRLQKRENSDDRGSPRKCSGLSSQEAWSC